MARWAVGVMAAIGVAVVGLGIDLCDYRTPTTDLLRGKVSFLYQHADDPGTPGVDQSSGWLTFDARRHYDSPVMGFTLAGSGKAEFSHLTLARASLGASAALRQYLADPIPVFAFGGVEAAFHTGLVQPAVEVQAGLGYGRFFNVTPLAKALHIEGQMLARAVLTVPLSDEDLLAVAAAIGQPVNGEPLAERVAAVVALIERMSRRKLDARSVLMIEETLAAPGRERYCGWTVQAGLGYELLDPRAGPRDLLLSLAFDAAIAPEPRSQLLFKTRISGPPWIAEQHTLTLDVTFDVRVNAAISFSMHYNLFQDKPFGQLPSGRQSATFQLDITPGWVGVSLQMVFSKLAEDPAWDQRIIVSATAHLW